MVGKAEAVAMRAAMAMFLSEAIVVQIYTFK